MKKLTKAIALAGVMTTGLTGAQLAQAEVDVSASAAVANMYLWRGTNLGSPGVPAVSGGLSVSSGGAYGGVWASSGDTSAGTEFDLYVGYGGEVEDFSYDISAWTYVYPGSPDDEDTLADESESNLGELSELILSLGYAGASFSYYYPLAGDGNDDYSYMTLGYGMDAYSATIGISDDEGEDADYVHLDLSYAYNDNISFTLSKVIDKTDAEDFDSADSEEIDDDLLVVVSYSLPIDL